MRRLALLFPPTLFVFLACAGGHGSSVTGAIPSGTPIPIPPAPRATASAAAPRPLPPPVPLPHLAPGQRSEKASLFATDVIGIHDGGTITPDATPGSHLFELDPHSTTVPTLRAGNAVATALSPDGKTLAVLTSGYNKTFDKDGFAMDSASGEWVFVYDVSTGAPRETQVLRVPNAFEGLAFHPKGDRLYVSGGSDDSVHEILLVAGRWEERALPMQLGHLDKKGYGGFGLRVSPYAAGIALSASGDRLVVANHENDSVTVIDTKSRTRLGEVALYPGGGQVGGTFPLGVVIVGEDRMYVTSQRDREVVEVDVVSRKVLRRIPVGGQPTKLVANRAGTRVYVANANSDSVSVIDRALGAVVDEIHTGAPQTAGAQVNATLALTLRGSNPNAPALSPDERTLFVSNGGNNTVAIVALSKGDRGEAPTEADAADDRTTAVLGLVPTGQYPTAVSVSADGAWLYVAHAKSPTGANPAGPWSHVQKSRSQPYAVSPGNQFSLQLVKAGLLAAPIPARRSDTLAKLTTQSLLNNRFVVANENVPRTLAALRGKVKHVILVVGENRTYDQVFGDLEKGDGDPKMLHWGEAITPNHRALARTYVTLDRFFDTGGVSGDGWQWTVGGRATDVTEKEVPLEYSGRGHHGYDWEGSNRNVAMGLASVAERVAANPLAPRSRDFLPGTNDVAGIDGPANGGRGLLWDAAIAAGLTVRNYGAFCDEFRYGLSDKKEPDASARIPLVRDPAKTKTRVAFPTKASLQAVTDPYFRGFDMKFADYWREKEWEREFDGYVAKGELPALEIVRLLHDHLGAFAHADDAVDTPDTQMADNDYAIGLLVEKVSKSPFWADTLIINIEDDAQNGADHVDSHRSFALFAGPYVKRGALVSTVYTTLSVLRTVEIVLGLPPLGQHDAVAQPIDDVFTETADVAPFKAIVPAVLRATRLPVVSEAPGEHAVKPRGDAAFWEAATAGFDFDHTDALPAERFNRVLWCGLIDGNGCTSERGDVAGRGSDADGD